MRYTIVLPLPPREAGKNAHSGWADRRVFVAPYLAEVRLRLRGLRATGGLPPALSPPVTIHLIYHLYDNPALRVIDTATGRRRSPYYRPTDCDNARGAAWCVQDALVREGFLPGDSVDFVRLGETAILDGRRGRDHQNRTCLVVHIDDVDGHLPLSCS